VWIVQSLGSAVFESGYNAASHSAGVRWPTVAIAWWQRVGAFMTIVLCAFVLTGSTPDAPTAAFWVPAIASITINAGTSLMYARALRESLSLTVPITALSPVMLLATEPLMTGRFVPALGMAGIGVIAIGLYLLNFSALRTHGPLGPFKSVWKEKGPRLMLFVVMCWAVTAPLDRMAIEAWHPLWFAAALHGGIAVLLTPLWIRSRVRKASAPGEWKLIGLGPLSGIASMFQMVAMTGAPVAMVIALRRFAAPLTAVWGRLFFGEKDFKTRIVGAVIMTAGGALMLMSL
jgi:drug/metabolite transporter (DMT)-like permease